MLSNACQINKLKCNSYQSKIICIGENWLANTICHGWPFLFRSCDIYLLWPSDTIQHQASWSTPNLVMAWFLFVLSTEPLGRNFIEIWIKTFHFSFKEMHLKILSVKCQPSLFRPHDVNYIWFLWSSYWPEAINWSLKGQVWKWLSMKSIYGINVHHDISTKLSSFQQNITFFYVNMVIAMNHTWDKSQQLGNINSQVPSY